MKISRREILEGLLVGAAASFPLIGAGCTSGTQKKGVSDQWKTLQNEHFYTAEGKFDEDAAKKAFYDMFTWVRAKVYEKDRNFQRFHLQRYDEREQMNKRKKASDTDKAKVN